MITLDASVLIAHLAGGDRHFGAARNILRQAAGEALLVHPLTLAEVLIGGVNVGREHAMLAELDAMGFTVADGGSGQPVRLARLRVSTGLKLPNCCVLDTALSHRTPLATFDGALAGAARDVGVVVMGAS